MFQTMAGLPGTLPVAACDLNRDFWFETKCGEKTMAEMFPQTTFFESFEEMIAKARLDILLVETPAHCHASFCDLAMRSGIMVYSDIPTIRSLAEADMLWKTQQETGVMFMSGSTTMGWGFVLELQDLYKRGLLGKPVVLEAEYIHDCRCLWQETPWRKPSRKCNMLPIRYCTHSLGPLLSVLDEELRTVYCLSTGSKVTDNKYAHDYMTALFQTPGGVAVKLNISFINNCKTGNHSYRIYGTEGYFEHLSSRGSNRDATTMYNSNLVEDAKELTKLEVDFSPYKTPYGKKFPEPGGAAAGHGGADSFLMQLFFDALRHGRPAPVSLQDGLRMTIPGIYAAESALKGGRQLTIHYPWEPEFADDVKKYRK